MAMKRGQRRDERGALQRLYDAQAVAEAQSQLDVLPAAQIAMQVEPLPEYGPELRVFAPVDKGRRYFRLQHIDRLHRNGKLTYEQHAAGTWYRDRYEAGRYDNPRTQDWTKVRGENVVNFTMPTIAQQAREQWRVARMHWPADMIGFMDRLLLRDELPRRHHRAAMRQLADIRRALDAMAKHLRL